MKAPSFIRNILIMAKNHKKIIVFQINQGLECCSDSSITFHKPIEDILIVNKILKMTGHSMTNFSQFIDLFYEVQNQTKPDVYATTTTSTTTTVRTTIKTEMINTSNSKTTIKNEMINTSNSTTTIKTEMYNHKS